jgi:hypothetical protein
MTNTCIDNQLMINKVQPVTVSSCSIIKTKPKKVSMCFKLINTDLMFKKSVKNQKLLEPYSPDVYGEETKPVISASNQRLLGVLNEILSQPDDKGEKWWNEFFRDLDKYRFKM